MKKTKRSLLLIMVVCISITLIFTLYCNKGERREEPKVIKIGAILPLTGPVSMYGDWCKKSIELAVDEINLSGGIKDSKLEVIYEDSQNEPSKAINAFNKLYSVEKTDVIISTMTAPSFSIIPLAEKNKIILFLTFVTHPDAPDKSQWVFRYFINKGKSAKIMADFMITKMEINETSILYIDDEGGQGEYKSFKEEFENKGGKIIFEEGYGKTQSDFKNLLFKLKNENPNSLYLIGYGRTYALLLRQLKEFDITPKLFTTFDITDSFVKTIAGDYPGEIIFTIAEFSSKVPVTHAYIEKYKTIYGSDPPAFYAAYPFDIVKMLSIAMKNSSKLDSENIRLNLLNIKNFDGVLGKTSILPNGDCDSEIVIKKFENGKIISID